MPLLPESLAARILLAALAHSRCAELLDCLFEGGSATVDGGDLVLLRGDQLAELLGSVGEER